MKTTSKKKLQEIKEKVEAMGSESEAVGKKAVREVKKEFIKAKKKKEDETLNVLDSKRKQIRDYRIQLIYLLHDEILKLMFDIRWKWGVWYDGKGIRVTIVDPYRVSHKRAFKPCYQPVYDLNAVERFIVWAEDIKDLFERKNGRENN